ncbi:MAG: nucleotidyltransferase domain-containing protein [Magnetococcus sp. YQC-5]
MIPMDVILQAAHRMTVAANPLKIILFGSYATGTANEDSDLDLMVITSEDRNRLEATMRLRDVIGDIGVGVDVLVYTPTEFENRLHWCTSPIYWASREGIVLYDATR